MTEEQAVVTRINLYEPGCRGRIHVRAQTQEAVQKAIDKLSGEYPYMPYMGTAGKLYKDENGFWNAIFEHWGAD